MDCSHSVLDIKLFELTCNVVKESLVLLRRKLEKKEYISTFFKWPSLSRNKKTGFAEIDRNYGDGPPEYSSVFGLTEKSSINMFDIPSFVSLFEYVKNHSRLKSYWTLPDECINDFDWFKYRVLSFITSLIERYQYEYGNDEFSTDKLLKIYLPIEKGHLSSNLEVEILVPLVFITSDTDNIRLGPGLKFELISDPLHLARALDDYVHSMHEMMISGCATHALVFEGYSFANNNHFFVNSVFDNSIQKLTTTIDKFIAALRMITGIETGYAQLLIKPSNWSFSYKAMLPTLFTRFVKKYPKSFEDFKWLEEQVVKISLEDIKTVYEIFLKLQNNSDNRLDIACRRLNLACLRESDEDSILDISIGFEALLSDSSTEIIHKLALRVAALSSLSKETASPSQVFKQMKYIYKYRSAIIHGNSKSHKYAQLVDHNNVSQSTKRRALELLRMSIQVLTEYPEYLVIDKLDSDLLLESLVKKQS